MACQSVTGITASCVNTLGGLQKIYVANLENISYTQNSIGTITGMTMVSGATFQEFQFPNDTASFEDDTASDAKKGNSFQNQKVELFIPRRDASKRAALLILTAGNPKLAIIVQDMNDTYWLLGAKTGLYCMSIKGGSGKAKADSNAYTIEFAGDEILPAPVVDPSVISAIIAH